MAGVICQKNPSASSLFSDKMLKGAKLSVCCLEISTAAEEFGSLNQLLNFNALHKQLHCVCSTLWHASYVHAHVQNVLASSQDNRFIEDIA